MEFLINSIPEPLPKLPFILIVQKTAIATKNIAVIALNGSEKN